MFMAGEEVNLELSGNADVAGDAMPIAAGRSPNIDGIGLDRAGHRAGIAPAWCSTSTAS